MNKIRIAVDMDEVMVPMLPSLKKHFTRTYKKPVPKRKCLNYNYSQIFDISPKQAQWLVYSFWNSEEAHAMVPFPNSIETLKKMKEHYNLIIITGRQTYAQKCTNRFIDKYFKGIFDDVILTNSYSLSATEQVNKEVVCKNTKADFIIDDCRLNIMENTVHIPYVGDPIYPWCSRTDGLKMKNWEEIEDFFCDCEL